MPLRICKLENEYLRINVLPEIGGKIASLALAASGAELLQQPLKPYALRDRALDFDMSDASGWDECLPSIAACKVNYDDRNATITDHGDLWRLVWEVREQSDTRLHMSAAGTSLPLTLERTLTLDGNKLNLDYLVRNTGSRMVPYAWSAHPLFAIAPGDRIVLPSSVNEITTEASVNGRLGIPGFRHAWPFTTSLTDDRPLDLALAGQLEDGVGDKIIARAPKEGWCALDRLTLGIRVTIRFDPEVNPWLGIWLCYGGWPPGVNAKKGYAVALEPCTIPVDSLAEGIWRGAGRTLAPGEEHTWAMTLEVTQ